MSIDNPHVVVTVHIPNTVLAVTDPGLFRGGGGERQKMKQLCQNNLTARISRGKVKSLTAGESSECGVYNFRPNLFCYVAKSQEITGNFFFFCFSC